MSDKTGIEWTDATWNPVRGCTMVSDGCKHCYAMGVAGRFSGHGQPYEGLTTKTTQGAKWNGKIMLVPGMLTQPLKWQRPRKIFVNSMSDLFHPDIPDDYIDKVFAIMALAPHHVFQVLTKRPERMRAYLADHNVGTRIGAAESEFAKMALFYKPKNGTANVHLGVRRYMPLPNVWLGVSVENQAAADERIPLLLKTPASVRWVSAEPLLGPVSFRWAQWTAQSTSKHKDGSRWHLDGLLGISWVVVGGESGVRARPMHPLWARDLRDQCAAAGVPFLFKQFGEWAPTECAAGGDLGGDMRKDIVRILKPRGEIDGHFRHGDELMRKVGKKADGRTLDGQLHDGYPS